MTAFKGIDGLKGRDPVGVVVSVGRKGPKGNPIEKDRFHLMLPQAGGENRSRSHHPAYSAFNQAGPEKRLVIPCMLVHAELGKSFYQQRKAQRIKAKGEWIAHPGEIPVCGGDGIIASRWAGEDKWKEIPCPGKLCEFAEFCKPFSKAVFQLRWPKETGLPRYFAKYTSGGWGTGDNMIGFIRHLEETAATCGIESPNWYGLPFVLTLSEKTRPKLRRAFPVVDFSVDGDPLAFLQWQQKRLIELGGTLRLAPAPSVDDPEEKAAIVQDLAELSPGIPAHVDAEVVDEDDQDNADHAEQVALFSPAPEPSSGARLAKKDLEKVRRYAIAAKCLDALQELYGGPLETITQEGLTSPELTRLLMEDIDGLEARRARP